jgi:hypothetical protein
MPRPPLRTIRPLLQGPNVSTESSLNPEPATPPDAGVDGALAPTWIERVVASPVSRSAYASVVAHVLLGILLALATVTSHRESPSRPLVLALDDGEAEAEGPDATDTVEIGPADDRATAGGEAEIAPDEVASAGTPAEVPDLESIEDAVPMPEEAFDIPPADASLAAADGPRATAVAVRLPSDTKARGGAALPADRPTKGGVSGVPYASRRGEERGLAARGKGGSPASEAAVERGLAWLALHQANDGSWRFDLDGCRCEGACRDPGTLSSTTASTAIALLPFLGAGSTHLEGRYQETVSRGLYYLLSRMQSTPRGGDLCEGTMYGHGIATLVLAEALGMTGDDLLRKPCRDAVRFIETSQDLHGGGWRYLPGQAGDITVTTWQVAALRSAGLAGVETSSPTFEGARRFLDSVATQKGAAYGYRTPAAAPCTSAIGLLCRMYTGWGVDEEPLQRGITTLARPGPKPHAIYQNFYLAQALIQSDHPVWPRWNSRNRDQIVALQSRVGHETGSWFFADRETAPGGRLAHTALAVLTLEVYYRLLPIYRQEAVTDAP